MSFDPYGNALAMGQTNMPFNRRRRGGCRGCFGCLIPLVVIAVLVVSSYVAFAHTWPIFGPSTITVKGHPTLIITSTRYEKVDIPTIHIHAGKDTNKIVLQVTSPGNVDLPASFGIGGFQQNEESNIIAIDSDPVYGRRLDVTVPANTDLKISSNAVYIDVDGITGQMTLLSNSGHITLTHCHVTGTSLIHNNAGDITVNQTELDGQSTLNDNMGTITFNGTIASSGTYAIEDNQGAVDVTLPQSMPFHLDATTISGSYTVSYPGVQVQNKEIHANVGNNPQAHVSLTTNAGTITLHQ